MHKKSLQYFIYGNFHVYYYGFRIPNRTMRN